MRGWMSIRAQVRMFSVLAIVAAIAVSVALVSPSAPAQAGNSNKIYTEQGGAQMTVASGGTLDVQAGATFKSNSVVESKLGSGVRVQGNLVVVKPGASIQAAIDAITDASDTNRTVVLLAPGIYDQRVTLKRYVSLWGSGRNVSIIRPTTALSAGGAVNFSNDTEIRSLSIDCQDVNAGGSSTGWSMGNAEAAAVANVLIDDCYLYSDHDWIRSKTTGTGTNRDVSNFVISNCSMAGTFDGILMAGSWKMYGCKLQILNTTPINQRCAVFYPDSAATAEIYDTDVEVINSDTNDLAAGVLARVNSVMSFYGCRFRITQNGGGNAYGFYDQGVSTAMTVNFNHCDLLAAVSGGGSALDISHAGGTTVNARCSSYATSSGTIANVLSGPKSLKASHNNWAALSDVVAALVEQGILDQN